MIFGKSANRVLKKDPPKGEIKKKDVISVNDSFTSRLHKVKIPTVTAKPVSFLWKIQTMSEFSSLELFYGGQSVDLDLFRNQ